MTFVTPLVPGMIVLTEDSATWREHLAFEKTLPKCSSYNLISGEPKYKGFLVTKE